VCCDLYTIICFAVSLVLLFKFGKEQEANAWRRGRVFLHVSTCEIPVKFK